jgi:thioredoxin-like negative regulator of GroEL
MIERLLAADAALERDDAPLARKLFEQVADADPRNAIAIVGLARVAARLGEPERARALAERALAVDPLEAAANRLIADLDAAAAPAPVPEPVARPARRGFRAWLARIFGRR